MKLLISTHSFIDVITNSSTELFMCDTYKTVEQVKDLLKDMLDAYNKSNNTHKKFEDIFGVDIYTKDQYENDTIDPHSIEWLCGYEKKENIGKIIVMGDDSDIPYELYECIESLFNAERFHLG